MHRRARHLNARHAGAGLVLDARRISGLNDGDAVSTWNDVSGNSYNATQATAANRPTYRTGVFGGSAACQFDGNDILETPSYSADIIHTAICVFKATTDCIVFERSVNANSQNGGIYQYTTVGFSTLVRGSGIQSSRNAASSWGNGSVPLMTTSVYSGSHNSHELRSSGVSIATTSGSTSNPSGTYAQKIFIGARSGVIAPITGHIGLFIFSPYLGAAITKRLEHSAAFSFKIQCS